MRMINRGEWLSSPTEFFALFLFAFLTLTVELTNGKIHVWCMNAKQKIVHGLDLPT